MDAKITQHKTSTLKLVTRSYSIYGEFHQVHGNVNYTASGTFSLFSLHLICSSECLYNVYTSQTNLK